ncbi:TRAP transporter substrate-binding protein [Alkalibacter mobilis]|uniref:TRAP transporter substrate-binding protein n=1 Tax=Alkalibacter mobilis TaxID=2787712 RepID=UPI00189D13AE|nr:TRAP transporter substrate-binding protein [Alkalibacter mobilis]MBF7095699.1 TRAP transporter substrate-binding protein [Alkalibacter mobilis]
MKKILALLMVLVLTLGFAACSSDDGDGGQDDQGGIPEMSISLQSSGIDSVPLGEGYKKFKELVEEKTEGKVTVDLYWSSSLFAQDQTAQALISNNLDMANTQSSFLTDYVPEFNMLSSAYIFKNSDHWDTFYKSDIADELFEKLADNGVRVLGVCNLGSRTINLTEDKKVTTRDDLSGVKFRVPNSDVWLFMGEALGGNPVGVPYSDLYVSLQTGVVNGQDNPLANIKEISLQEVTKSITMSQHMFSTEWLAISEKKWDEMTPELQQIFKDAAVEAMELATEGYKAQEDSIKEFMTESGVTVYELTDEELAGYRQEVVDYYFADDSMTAEWDMDLYERIQNLQ